MAPNPNNNNQNLTALIAATREQTRRLDLIAELLRQQARAQGASGGGPARGALGGGPGSGSLVGQLAAGRGPLSPLPAGPGVAGGIVGAGLAAVGDVIKRALSEGLAGRSSAIRGTSGFESGETAAARADFGFRKGAVEGLLKQVPFIGEELAARNDLRVRRQTEPREFAVQSGEQETISTFREAARAGVKLDPEIIRRFQEGAEARGMLEADFIKQVKANQSKSNAAFYGSVSAIGSLSLG